MKKLLVSLGLLAGSVVGIKVSPVDAALSNCYYTNFEPSKRTSICTAGYGMQRIRISCSNGSTRYGSWVTRGHFSTALCYQSNVIYYTIEKRA